MPRRFLLMLWWWSDAQVMVTGAPVVVTDALMVVPVLGW